MLALPSSPTHIEGWRTCNQPLHVELSGIAGWLLFDVVWVGRRASTPCPGHSSLETMTEPDYDNDLVFRSGGKEYARIDGNGEWKPQTPAVKFEISAKDNDEDVTELVKHVAEKVEGVNITTKEGGSIKMTGDAMIQMSDGAIKIG